MKYLLFDILNEAIMTNTPAVIVEGKDDPQVYHRIANLAEKEVVVYSVNMIDDCTTGLGNGDKVIECIQKLQHKYTERIDNVNRILGVIDRDSKPYTTSPTSVYHTGLPGLLILKYYSFESYFANRVVLKRMVEKLTYLSPAMVNEALLDIVEQDFLDLKEDLYYLSLEALSDMCITTYRGIVTYGMGGVKDTRKRQEFYSQVVLKKTTLDTFAASLNLTISDLKKICKGKWYLQIYLGKAFDKIKALSSMCQSGTVPQCKHCFTGESKECRYRAKKGYDYSSVGNEALEVICPTELSDLIARFSTLINEN